MTRGLQLQVTDTNLELRIYIQLLLGADFLFHGGMWVAHLF